MKSTQKFEKQALRALILGLALMAVAISALFPTPIPSPFHLTDVAAVTCTSSQYDMLDYMTLDPDYSPYFHLEGTHPLWTYVSGSKVYWIKNIHGGVWDINRANNGNIYWWATEVEGGTWDNATGKSYRAFSPNSGQGLLAMRRCTTPGSGSLIVNTDTAYQVFTGCSPRAPQNVLTAKFKVEGPVTLDVGGNLGSLRVLKLTYKYNCDSSASNCTAYEVYWLDKTYGLVRWEKYVPPFSGPVNSSTFNLIVPNENGVVIPQTPCFSLGALLTKSRCIENAEE